MIRLLLASIIIALVAAEAAAAEPVEVTAQAKASAADFLLRATPPGPAATICLVDTGVNATPDTPGTVARFSVSGDVTDQSPTFHGTQMSAFIGAPSNGFGMVGLWPSARILSVRANEAGQDAFTAVNFIKGIQRCSEAATAFDVKVVLMAYSSSLALTAEEAEVLYDEIKGARASGISFVAAAGNHAGGPVGSPANVPGVLSVGATNTATGDRCGFSATGALLLAPGCGLDGADPTSGTTLTTQEGTSHAAAVAAAALAALRTWRPDLTPDAAERLLNETGKATMWGRSLDLGGNVHRCRTRRDSRAACDEPAACAGADAPGQAAAPQARDQDSLARSREHAHTHRQSVESPEGNAAHRSCVRPRSRWQVPPRRVPHPQFIGDRDADPVMAPCDREVLRSCGSVPRQQHEGRDTPMRLLAAILGLALALSTYGGVARAAVFEVRSCSGAATSSFALINTNPGTIDAAAQCPALPQTLLSGLFAAPADDENTPHGDAASWTVTAPRGLKIARLDVRRSIGTRRDAWKVTVRTGEGRLLESCELAGRLVCQLGDPRGDASAAYRDLNTQSVIFSLSCDTDPDGLTCPGRELRQAWIAIYSAVAVVDDPSPPVIDSLTGSALDAGWHNGDQRLDLSASDLSGIRSVLVSAGSTTLFQQEQPCDYSRMQPCPATKQTSFAVDTSRLTDGTHELKVTVTDAAGQAAVATSTLRVDRTAPAAPAELYVERNPDGPSRCCGRTRIRGPRRRSPGSRYEVCSALGVACVGGPVDQRARDISDRLGRDPRWRASRQGVAAGRGWKRRPCQCGDADGRPEQDHLSDRRHESARADGWVGSFVAAEDHAGSAVGVDADDQRDDRSCGERADRGAGVAKQDRAAGRCEGSGEAEAREVDGPGEAAGVAEELTDDVPDGQVRRAERISRDDVAAAARARAGSASCRAREVVRVATELQSADGEIEVQRRRQREVMRAPVSSSAGTGRPKR